MVNLLFHQLIKVIVANIIERYCLYICFYKHCFVFNKLINLFIFIGFVGFFFAKSQMMPFSFRTRYHHNFGWSWRSPFDSGHCHYDRVEAVPEESSETQRKKRQRVSYLPMITNCRLVKAWQKIQKFLILRIDRDTCKNSFCKKKNPTYI